MGNYSEDFKKKMLKKLVPPFNKTNKALSLEVGVSAETIRNWRNKYLNNNKVDASSQKKVNISNAEKYKLLLKAKSLTENEYGKWLRSNGLYSTQIELWEDELEKIMKDDLKKLKIDNSKLKDENKKLKKDLEKKDKALSEASALLILKKKANLIWGEEEES